MDQIHERNESAYRDFFVQFFAGVERIGASGKRNDVRSREMQIKAYEYAICLLKETYRTTALKICFAGQEKNCLVSQAALWERGFFPPHYFAAGNLVPTAVTPYAGEALPVQHCCLISEGWIEDEILEAYDSVNRHGFQGGTDVEATYFPELALCYVTKGCTRAAMASLLQIGTIQPTFTCSLAQFFPHVTTDGESWVDLPTGRTYAKTYDYRIAAAYELLRRKYEKEMPKGDRR